MPVVVFYYSDGVSEGEYSNVLDTEGKAIEGERPSYHNLSYLTGTL